MANFYKCVSCRKKIEIGDDYYSKELDNYCSKDCALEVNDISPATLEEDWFK